LIDNAEAAQGIDTKNYPYISQIFLSIVTKDSLSTWEAGIVKNVDSKKTLPRTRELLCPTVETVVSGW